MTFYVAVSSTDCCILKHLPAMPKLKFEPKRKRKVIDVVRAAGVDVSDWGDYRRGLEYAAVNPKYCYEWAFVQPAKVVVLSIWYEDIEIRGEVALLNTNLREAASLLGGPGGKPVWRKRMEAMDQAVQLAVRDHLPIRCVVCIGDRRAPNDPESRPSTVKLRELDPVPWTVQAYDLETGRCILRRGALPERLVDQFSSLPTSTEPEESPTRIATVRERDPLVRDHARRRADGRCEWCGEYGFATDDGSMFLEIHHVIPLGEDGPDTIDNVVALCPNHHSEAHYGAAREDMQRRLQAYLSELTMIDLSGHRAHRVRACELEV